MSPSPPMSCRSVPGQNAPASMNGMAIRQAQRMALEKYRCARALRLQDGVPGGRTQTDHRAEGKDQVVHGQAEVQQGHAVGARRLGNEIGVGQNIARCADQTENILRHILEELLCQVHGSFLSAGRIGG